MNRDAPVYVYFREVQKPRQTWIWLVVLMVGSRKPEEFARALDTARRSATP